MRKIVAMITLMAIFTLCAQKTRNGLPVITSKKGLTDYRVGDDWYDAQCAFLHQQSTDTLFIPCYLPVEDVAIYSDKDSLLIPLRPSQTVGFYLSANDSSFLFRAVCGVKPPLTTLQFDTVAVPARKMVYNTDSDNDYLARLKEKYPIERIVKKAGNDTERALAVMHWVHSQWDHDGKNGAEKRDAISILDAAKKGENFRCVEYGIVTAACLNAIGLKARVISLKIKEVETTSSGAGHVAAEVYLNDLKKWALVDSQWDAMPVLNGMPLNAVEFQRAITNDYSRLRIASLSEVSKRLYVGWIYPYLYYFNYPIDNREGVDLERMAIDGKKVLMLVPFGAKEPAVFQITRKMDYCLYTHSLREFYAVPAP